VQIEISKDGVIDLSFDKEIDINKYNNPKETAYKIAVDNAVFAIDLCSPFRNMPLDKYQVWKEMTIEFDEDDIQRGE
jgi:hypothetical protein